jgi:hypothetical protein
MSTRWPAQRAPGGEHISANYGETDQALRGHPNGHVDAERPACQDLTGSSVTVPARHRDCRTRADFVVKGLSESRSVRNLSLVIIWLNGPFGGGKTTTASELHTLLPSSRLFDSRDGGVLAGSQHTRAK